MPKASSVQPGFLGGELSEFAQNRFDKPDYQIALRVCYNGFPTESGTWVRRPGSMFAGPPRGGVAGRVVKFDFSESNAVTIEFTDGYVRFRNGTALITTNDPATVSAISTANPAVVHTAAAHGWSMGNTVVFDNPAPAARLENRQFTITAVDATHFSLADALTGVGIDGATLGAFTSGRIVRRVHELVTSYVAQSWQTLRAVQAEKTAILLNAAIAPQALTVATAPTSTANAQFALTAAIFNDGPYLDPFVNGVEASPSATSGVINLQISFPAWSSTKAYAKGSFVTSSSVNYVSLVDQNINNTPASSPASWATTSAGAAINDGRGFIGTDVGRLVRLYSEPSPWNISATYAAGNEVVSYNPSGVPGAATYWQNQTAGNHGAAPGTDLINWKQIPQGAAVWTWGKITSLLNVISPTLAGSSNFGNLTQNGGINAAFDGVFSKSLGTCARLQYSQSGFFLAGTIVSLNTYVGKNFSGASAQRIQSAVVYPSSDEGFGKGALVSTDTGLFNLMPTEFLFNLRASQTPPTSSSNGTLLGTVGPFITASAVSITSNDQTTAWNYVWIELVVISDIAIGATSFLLDADIAQLSLFSPVGTSTSGGVGVEILGPPLLYTNPILTWQLGVYSNTTGWPTCGVHHEGRLWLGGAIGNRFDACKSGGINGTTIDFAPTNSFGQVADDNAITYTLSSDSVNPIFWMMPDVQGVIMGTQAGEFLVQAPTSGPITPTNIAARRVTRIGCANVEPRRTDHTNVFVHRFSLKLMEYFSDVFSGKFSAPNLADKAQHITRAGIAEIAYQQSATPIIWGRDNNGALFGISYKRDTLATSSIPTFTAWHRHALGSGRTVESLCTGPSVGGALDSLTMVTNDSTTGLRHVEVLTDTLDELNVVTDARYLDDAVAPSSYTISTAAAGPLAPYGGVTFNGLWHLNGKTVQVFAGGVDCGDRGDGNVSNFTDFVVSNGSVFVPFGDGISAGCGAGRFTYDFVQSFSGSMPVVIGFTFTSQGQTLRTAAPAESGARNGPALGKITRNHRYALHVVETTGLWVGGSFDQMAPVPFTLDDGITPLGHGVTYTGLVRDTLFDDHSLDGFLSWRVTRPWPVNIVWCGVFTATQDQ